MGKGWPHQTSHIHCILTIYKPGASQDSQPKNQPGGHAPCLLKWFVQNHVFACMSVCLSTQMSKLTLKMQKLSLYVMIEAGKASYKAF